MKIETHRNKSTEEIKITLKKIHLIFLRKYQMSK